MIFNEFGEIIKVEKKAITLLEYMQQIAKKTGKTYLEIADEIIDDE